MHMPHPSMQQIRPDLYEDLIASDFVRRPMPLHEENSLEVQLNEKKVLRRKALDDFTTLDTWTTVTEHAHIELSPHFSHTGRGCLKFTSPTKLADWPEHNGRKARGRIYTVPKAMRVIDRENWQDYNRLSVWIYADLPGFRSVSFRVQLHNDGEHKVPDVFDREGGHNVNLVNHAWNHITVEIPYVYRDEVVGVSFDYDMVGHERQGCETATWYIDELELQEVEDLEIYEGWQVGKGRIAYSHAGYQPGGVKTAIIGEMKADTFALVDAKTGKEALSAPIQTVTTSTGEFRVLDFTQVQESGLYFLRVGDCTTQIFPIDHRVWMSSIWKTLNFFFLERCGFDIPNKHMPCHTDYLVKHGDLSVVANGGWHDAADMSQQFPLTIEITHGMFDLAMKVKEDDTLLYKRTLEEGRWGLDYLLKGRFGDGYRIMSTGTAIWTDGIFGTDDDLEAQAARHPYENLMAAAAQVAGYEALKDDDVELAKYALRCAEEDFAYGLEDIDENYQPKTIGGGHSRMTSACQLIAQASHTASLLYKATGKQKYAEKAVSLGAVVVACQQKEIPDWDTPLTGFFWREPEHRNIVHYNHRSHEDIMSQALVELCRTQPDHPAWMTWYSSVQLHAKYVHALMEQVEPYGMMPNSIYHLREMEDRETFGKMHPISVPFSGGTHDEQLKAIFSEYQEQVKNGVRLSDEYFLRRFPVWYSYRGNFACILSLGKAVAVESILLNDYKLYDAAQQQFQWIIGKNPFGQSVMYGEGNNYAQQYAVLPGEMTGELPVGMESFENDDKPFWPQVNNCTYKEVWVAAPAKWLWTMADAYLPAKVRGVFADRGQVQFKHIATGNIHTASASTGFLDTELPAGDYEITYNAQKGYLAVVAGGEYRLDAPLHSFRVSAAVSGKKVAITVATTGAGKAKVALLAANLKIESPEREIDLCSDITFEAEIIDEKRAWTAALVPNGRKDLAVGVTY